MRETQKKKISINIGIPTYEAGESLVLALDSLYRQTSFHLVRKVIVIVDGNTISNKIKAKINNPKLQIIYGIKRQGQPSRINDIFESSNTDLVILTNDDVVLDKYALKNIVQTFIKTRADLISGAVTPLPGTTFLEKILFIGYQINRKIYRNWNNGDNYLSCNGRLLILSKRLYKKIQIPKKLWNNDAFLYLFVKVHHFKYAHEAKAIAWYRMPNQISEHIKQRSKFKQSYKKTKNISHLIYPHTMQFHEFRFLDMYSTRFYHGL